MLKIYNSFTRKKETFKPMQPGKIKIYVCGITVYDYCHLGHGRMLSAFDTIIRYLRWRDFEVTYVRNITDVDDKIINRANENKEAFSALTERFIAAMHEDIAALGLLKPNLEPCATDHIAEIIAITEKLIANNYAYVADNGDVYFEVRHFKPYGKLAHRDLEKLASGIRVDIVAAKKDPLDFVLWKIAKPGEPSWDSPWGKGRPGWHIECSAMSTAHLGNHFDIHGGGKDLIFPHHENEIAQSEASTGEKFVNTWMHVGYLQIDKEKMSKSLGNFFTIRDVLAHHSAEVVRYFILTSHYRSPLQYSEAVLTQARVALERFYTALRGMPAATPLKDSEFENKFIAAMDDDFNTPIALAVLFDLAREVNRLRNIDLSQAAQQAALLKKLGGVLNILQEDADKFLQTKTELDKDVDVKKIEDLIVARNQARADKNWAQADKIRDELLAMSIVLEDGANGTQWKRV